MPLCGIVSLILIQIFWPGELKRRTNLDFWIIKDDTWKRLTRWWRREEKVIGNPHGKV